MCITFIYLASPEEQDFPYKLIILNNRDEEFDRPTSKLTWENKIIAGRDEKAAERGTWFGVSSSGRIGILLSITEPKSDTKPYAPSRGRIIKDYLEGHEKPIEYCSKLAQEASKFNGFQFVCLNRTERNSYELYTLTNLLVDKVEPILRGYGVHGVGNSPMNKPFQKVIYGEKLFDQIIQDFKEHQDQDRLVQALLRLATDQTKCLPDQQLETQLKQKEESYQYLSSIFVRFPESIHYGTRK
uniref:Uncharacterized protein n=1 Tax=Acrobeloides nanus TaxID=290746 RepID=A0A914BVU0_9BILA